MQLPVLPTISDVAARQLCCGCGACAHADPVRYEMIDDVEHGRRPRVRDGAPPERPGADALRACPGIALEHSFAEDHPGLAASVRSAWGPVLEVWEGFATDAAVRHHGSSGGAATALALASIERGDLHGVLHVRGRRDAPLLNETVLSTDRAALLDATGSRYAPASPCERLDLVERAPGPCVFIGKPCDVAAVHRLGRLRPALRGRVGLTIALFCAGTPALRGTLELLARLGVDDPADVVDLRYRGRGWPGRFTATVRTVGGLEERSLPYETAWSILRAHKAWRCHVCPDHTGEFADIAVGDPWHHSRSAQEPGRSLVVVRTERGRRRLATAVRAGYLELRRVEPEVLPRAQPELERVRGAVGGRLLMLRLAGLPAPALRGFPMLGVWWKRLPWREKLRSTLGTLRRIRRRRLRAGISLTAFDPAPPPAALRLVRRDEPLREIRNAA